MESRRSSRQIVRFGRFELDQAAGELRKDGLKLRLQEQPLQVLEILLEQPGKVVTREELQGRIWPSDTFVDFDHGINNAIKRLREVLGDTADTPRYVETLPRRGYRFIGKIETEGQRLRSLAVLPLENLSHDPEQEYFADGLTEALITTLAKIGELRVSSRSSSMLYKGVRKPLREIASELSVDRIVEGTVLRDRDRVRVTAQLIDPGNDAHLWAESYERHLSHILDVQAEVAQAIARQIQIKLTPQEQAQLAQKHSVDPEAYEAYLKGRYHWLKRSPEGHANAIRYFCEAIEKDSACAVAYAGLSDAVAIMGLWGLVSPDEGSGKAKTLASKALELDSSLADAHTSAAWAAAHYDYDLSFAEEEFERAIELNPRSSIAHDWFGMTLGMAGRYEEAFTELKRAVRLDPHVSVVRFGMAFVYWCGRLYDEGIQACSDALQLDPHSTQAHVWLGLCHVAKSDIKPAIAALERAVELSDGAPVASACLGEAYAAGGCSDEAHRILAELSRHQHLTKYFMSRIFVALDRLDEALKWLEEAYREHGEWVPLLKVDPRFDGLRSDFRVQNLLRRMQLSDATPPLLSAQMPQ